MQNCPRQLAMQSCVLCSFVRCGTSKQIEKEIKDEVIRDIVSSVVSTVVNKVVPLFSAQVLHALDHPKKPQRQVTIECGVNQSQLSRWLTLSD